MVMGMAGIASPAQAAAETYTVSGTVTDSNDSPLTGGYRVSMFGGGQLYDAPITSDGTYSLSAPAGIYSMDVTFDDGSAYPGFTFSRIQVLVTSDIANKNLSVATWPTGSGSISGSISDSVGPLASNVSISSNVVHFSQATGSDGNYSFTSLPDGTYSVSISSANHYPQNFTTWISGGSSVIADRTLQVNSTNTLTGHILSNTGSPLSSYTNIGVTANTANGWATSSSITSQGLFYMSNLPTGKVTLNVYGGQNARIYSQSISLNIESGENIKDVVVDSYPTGPRKVSGRVLASGNPVPFAGVSLYSADGKQNYSTTTNSNGDYTFLNLAAGKYSLNAYRNDYRSVNGSYKSVQLQEDQDSVVDLALALRASGILIGQVTNSSDNSQAIAGSINVCLTSTWECSYASVDALGNFFLQNVPMGNLQVRIYPTDRSAFQIRTTSFNMIQSSMVGNFTVEQVPPGSASINGTVTSPDSGAPIPHASVALSIYGPNPENGAIQTLQVQTDNDGRYSFSNLVKGRATLTIYGPQSGNYQQSYLEVPLGEGESKTLNLYLQSSNNSLTLDVCATLCAGTETRIKDMQIQAVAYGPKYEGGPDEALWYSNQSVTTPQGQLLLTGLPAVAAGKLRLTFDPNNSTTGGFMFAEISSGQSGTVSEGIGFNQDIQNGQYTGSIELPGFVRAGTQSISVLFKNLQGEIVPTSNFSVQTYRTVSGLTTKRFYENGAVQTDSNGFLTINNLLPYDSVSITSADNSSLSCYFQIKSNQISRSYVCQELAQDTGETSPTGTGSISGAVVDQNNASVVNGGYDIQVELCQAGIGACWNSQVDSEGAFSFNQLPNGSYLLRALSQNNRFLSGMATEIVLSDAENTLSSLSLSITKLPEGKGNSISATLVDSRLNKPIPNVNVTAQPIEITGVEVTSQEDYLGYWATSDFSGSFRLDNLTPGTYRLSFNKYSDSGDYSGTLNREVFAPIDDLVVRIGEGEQVALPDVIWDSENTSDSNTLTVKLIDKFSREPLVISDTDCWIVGANEPLRGIVDASGTYTFRNLIVGKKYTINCSSTSSFSTAGQMVEPLLTGQTFIAEAGTNTLVLPSNVIKMRGKISGRVVDEHNAPIVGVQVNAGHGWDDCSEDSFGCGGTGYGDTDMTDADGYFFLENLPEITDDFTVSAPGFSYVNEKVDMSVNREQVRNVVLYPIKKLSGKILDSNGLPVGASQQVELVSATDASQWGNMQVNADSKGQYLFSGVGFGDYYIRLIRSSNATSNQVGVSGYLTETGAITSQPSLAKVFTISGSSDPVTTVHDAVVPAGASISGSVRFVDGSGNLVAAKSANLVARLYIKDGNDWRFIRSLDQWLSTKAGVSKYSFKGLVSGSYKLRFSDVPWNGQGLTTIYNGNKATLAEATEIAISNSASQTGIDVSLSAEKPAALPPTLQLNFENFSAEQISATEDAIRATVSGEVLQVQGPVDQAGQWVSVAYSEDSSNTASLSKRSIRGATLPQQDWVQLDANGVANFAASTLIGANSRKLALISSQNQLLGWTTLAAKPHLFSTPIPQITGAFGFGQLLTAQSGTWDAGVTFDYVWKRDGQPIAGAIGNTYRLTRFDIGHNISVVVTGSKTGVDSVSKTSLISTVVTSIPLKPETSRISGTAAKGRKLTLISSNWASSPAPSIKYQWYRCSTAVKNGSMPKSAKCRAISKATKVTYTLTSADRRKFVVATTTASNNLGRSTLVVNSTSRVR